ncbi:hypothetical protein TNCV_3461801 [Trichonephila clavipes]|nr:hypothetical protein TNCV_3461801 [Trichonephila clavipes]
MYIEFEHPYVLGNRAQWSSGSVSCFHITGPGSIPRLDRVDSAFHPYCSRSINEYHTSLLRDLNTGVSLQIDHLIGTSAHAPQRLMVTYTGMGPVGPVPNGLLRHRV